MTKEQLDKDCDIINKIYLETIDGLLTMTRVDQITKYIELWEKYKNGR